MKLALLVPALLGLFALSNPAYADPTFERSGACCRCLMSNGDVQTLKRNAGYIEPFIPEPSLKAAIKAGVAIIDLTNELGGRNGVEISHVIGTNLITVWPQGKGSVFDTLVKLANDGEKQGKKVIDHVTGIIVGFEGKIASGFNRAFGVSNQPIPAGLLTTQSFIGTQEKFRMIANDNGSVSFAAHSGYLSYRVDNKGMPIANRDSRVPGGWEDWDLVRNSDGTVSIKNRDTKMFISCPDSDNPYKGKGTNRTGGKSGNTIYEPHPMETILSTYCCRLVLSDNESHITHFNMSFNADGTVSFEHRGRYLRAHVE